MRKKIITLAIIFIITVFTVKSIDIIRTYDVSLVDYYKFSESLSKNERTYLNRNNILYGIDIMDEPYSFVSYETNQNAGMMVDYFSQLSIALEHQFIGKAFKNYNLATSLKNGEIDAAVLNRTEINDQVFLFTPPLYYERSKILVRGESDIYKNEDVKNISIAIISGTTAHHAANQYFNQAENVNLVLTKDLDESFFLFGMGEVDAICGDEAKISYHLNQAIKRNQFRFLEDSLYEEEVGIAVNRDNYILFSIFNKGIIDLKKNNQYDHINSKWFGSFIPEMKEQKYSGISANITIVILTLGFIMLIWNQTVTERVNIRTLELKESREEIRDMIDSLSDAILVTDQNGIVASCNKSMCRLLGEDFSKLINKKIDEINSLDVYLKNANKKEPLVIGNRYYLVYQRRLNEHTNKGLVVVEDYTEQYKHEILTRQEAKMIAVGELSAGLAHEIRNPLGLIKSYIYIVKKKTSGEIVEHAVNVMNNSVDRINSLIENLLNFSRLSTEGSEVVDLEKLVFDLVSLERKNLDRNNISIKWNISPKTDKAIRINKDTLNLCLVNLINNSIDALSQDKESKNNEDKLIDIKIIVSEKLTIEFWDNGCGIPKSAIETIFNPFFTTKDSGTGLGLYIMQSELAGIGGSISADSQEGMWTRFTINLPIEGESD